MLSWYVTGDRHGACTDLFEYLNKPVETVAVIVLGDLGINYYLDKREEKAKSKLNSFGNYIYAVRGNHEERPQNVPGHVSIYDENVMGEVWYHPDFPYLRYFKDGGEYTIDGRSVLVIGGAYSVDKSYRLSRGFKWFSEEQLDIKERKSILKNAQGKKYDIVLTHTCPKSWEPIDLFLADVDQTTVDSSMEDWFQELEQEVEYGIWLFGHFHENRLVRPHAMMLLDIVIPLENIWNYWFKGSGLFTRRYTCDPRYHDNDCRWAKK